MLILTIRTDKPESEIGLYMDDKRLSYIVWPAHRHLAETLHIKIRDLLQSQSRTLQDVQGIVCYAGPGSFTGLRIGLSVANALAYGLSVPIIAEVGETNTEGDTASSTYRWLTDGIDRLLSGDTDHLASPHYGADAHITLPKKS